MHNKTVSYLVLDYSKLLKYLQERIRYEQSALADDDPKSACAANHRGVIRSLEELMERINSGEFNIELENDDCRHNL